MKRISPVVAVIAVAVCIGGWPTAPARAQAEESADQCVACHANPDFLVTNKKLYDYFQNWRSSVHGLEEVTCVNCHGGSTDISDQNAAHATMTATAPEAGPVSYRQVPATCGACHEAELEAYKTSRHYQLMETRRQLDRGPNCVTCHGSLNVQAPTVRTVADTCQRCHNTESENHPDVPVQAERMLNELNTIRGFQLYVSRRGEGELRAKAMRELDIGVSALMHHWHTFDLESIADRTDKVLKLSKAQFEAVREARRGSKPDN